MQCVFLGIFEQYATIIQDSGSWEKRFYLNRILYKWQPTNILYLPPYIISRIQNFGGVIELTFLDGMCCATLSPSTTVRDKTLDKCERNLKIKKTTRILNAMIINGPKWRVHTHTGKVIYYNDGNTILAQKYLVALLYFTYLYTQTTIDGIYHWIN